MTRLRRGARWTAVGLIAVAGIVAASGGCIAPPLLLPTARVPIDLSRFPSGTELVELPVSPDETLRGVWVPAIGPGPAPIIVDFLESSGTIDTGALDLGFTATIGTATADEPAHAECRAEGAPLEPLDHDFCAARRRYALLPLLGFASLCMDYAGVGASSGERSTDNLRRDAHAVWDEALRRAGGDASRIVLRGTSVGALVVAALLQDGARPGGVILVAPVRAETITRNGAQAMGRGLEVALVGWLLRTPIEADLLAELRRLQAPLLVVVPERDEFLRHDERAQLLAATDAARGVFVVRHADHVALSLAARDVLAVEGWFLGRLPLVQSPAQRVEADRLAWRAACDSYADPRAGDFDVGQPGHARLEAVEDVLPLAWPGAACALAALDQGYPERREFLEQLSWLPPAARGRLDPCGLARLADLDDPAGRFSPDEIRRLRGCFPELVGATSGALVETLSRALAMQDQHLSGVGYSMSISGEFHITRPVDTTTALAGWIKLDWPAYGGTLAGDGARRLQRLVFKAGGVPDRVSLDAAGTLHVEVLEAGGWRVVPPPVAAP
ncbi:MAG TPA: alpha/beta hydrolase [Planctomycetota bacterium]|nr:alpha/beta hydrolase [Planctomycetota bacterium]